jgi:hypothetical protein
MKKMIMLTALAAVSFSTNVFAQQDDPDKNYIRNSLYMMKLDEPCPKEDYAEAFKIMSATFDTINFARNYERYNDFSLKQRRIELSKLPEVTQAEKDAVGKESKLDKMTADILRQQGLKNSLSEVEYAARLLKYFEQNKFAQNLVAKWHAAPDAPEGTTKWDNDLSVIMELGLKGLSQEAVDNAKATENLTAVVGGAENKLLSNSYICVNRYGYMDAKEVVALTGAVLQATLGDNALAQLAIKKGTELAEKKVKGYFVRANAYLFKLDWNNDTYNKFYTKYWEKSDGFMNDNDFKVTYVGKSSKRAPAAMSLKSSTTLDKLIARATVRGTDAAIAALQRDHEEFRPMTSLHVIDGKLAAYIGMKEGIKSGDKFNVYEAVQSKDDPNLTEWKEIGSIKAGKEIWDNRAGAGDQLEGQATDKDDDDDKASAVPYTVFSGKPGKMGEGCMIRLAK